MMVRTMILLLTIALSMNAQEPEVSFHRTAEEQFQFGVRQYSQKEFRSALTAFRQVAAAAPDNHRVTMALLMAAKSEFALRNYSAALELLDTLEARYPSTEYREDIHFTRGMCAYNTGDYDVAFRQLTATLFVATQERNRTHAAVALEQVASEYLTDQQLNTFITDTLDGGIRNLLVVVQAERSFRQGDADAARTALRRFQPALSDQALQSRVNRLLSRIDKGNAVRIGVLLPLMRNGGTETREGRIAAEVLEGIQLAVSDQEERSMPGQVSVELDVRDSERDSAVIASVIDSWGADPSITGVVGPVFSAETMVAARMAQQRQLPIVSPTASDEGISAIGPYVFQANSTNGVKGKALAQYAVQVLGARRVAVLASSAPAPSVQADSFLAEVKRLGVEVVTEKRFRKGEMDIRSYVRAMRVEASQLRPDYIVSLRGKQNTPEVTRKLVSLGVKFSYLDSITATTGLLNMTAIFGDSAKRIADTLKLPVRRTVMYVDSLNYPVSTIDVLFCPIANSHEIGVTTSQLAFYNIHATVLGSGDWNDPNELDLNKRYANGVQFGQDRWIERNEATNRVMARYTQRFGRSMSDNVMFGYDAMSVVLRQLAAGAVSREQLAAALAAVVEFPGLRNAISLSPDRVNGALNILQYKNGAVTKLSTYSYRR